MSTHVGLLRSLVAYADGPDVAASPPAAFAADDWAVLLGWVPEARPWIGSDLRGCTVMAGYALADAVAAGQLRYIPTRLSAVPRLVEHLAPEIAVIPVVRRGSGFAYTGSVGWAPLIGTAAGRVVLELDPDGEDLGAPAVELAATDTITANRPPVVAPSFQATPLEEQIAELVLQLLPPHATLQFGPGGVASAIVQRIDRPVGVWSGLLTDDVAALATRGMLREPAVGAYAWGGAALRNLCRSAGARLTSIAETHDPGRIAEIDGFVALNTAVQVGLDGSVNVERAGRRIVAGMGGHPDFCSAAARSQRALSVIALRAAHRDRSNIVASVETVSTPRCDVDIVVTEHGVADLRGLDGAERAARLVAIAAPEHRAALEQQVEP